MSEGVCRRHQCQKLSGIFYRIVELLRRPFPSPDIIVRDAGLEPVFEELLQIYNFHLHQRGLGWLCRIGNTFPHGGGQHPQVGSYKGGSSKNLCEFCKSYLIASIANLVKRFDSGEPGTHGTTIIIVYCKREPIPVQGIGREFCQRSRVGPPCTGGIGRRSSCA